MSLTKRQSEIIDAALKLTAEGGIQNLTIKNLGNALGITEPAIYRHFRSKSEIVRTMIGRFDEAEYESLFGGVFYLFVRVVSPDHPCRGVFHDKPPYELVRQLEELIG